AGKLPAIRGASHAVGAQLPDRELEVAAVEAVVDAENEMGPVRAQDVQVVAPAEGHAAPVEEAEDLDERVEQLVHPRRAPLDAVVEIYARAVEHGGLLEHLLDPDVH